MASCLGDTLKRSYVSNTIAFEDNGVHVLLMGKKDIPSFPLVCLAEIDVLANNNEIKQAFFVYSLSILHYGEACQTICVMSLLFLLLKGTFTNPAF